MRTYVYAVYTDFHTFARDVFSFTYGNDCKIKNFHSMQKACAERDWLKLAGIHVSSIKFKRITWDVKNGEENETEKKALELFNS